MMKVYDLHGRGIMGLGKIEEDRARKVMELFADNPQEMDTTDVYNLFVSKYGKADLRSVSNALKNLVLLNKLHMRQWKRSKIYRLRRKDKKTAKTA